ncbi:hypothetical protein RhiirA4_475787 [Rhizophagus irregularis]|uniref:Uncharacterized protein n=1 Tax=Rhizophagus irregularis TaxID=588596 RepID=A0A2I1HAM4_9GLOM|nr:hypothetical protein RhiirA4_475787 [Rhizophagus irregularis]
MVKKSQKDMMVVIINNNNNDGSADGDDDGDGDRDRDRSSGDKGKTSDIKFSSIAFPNTKEVQHSIHAINNRNIHIRIREYIISGGLFTSGGGEDKCRNHCA